jgi:hypothetical protein
MKYSLLFLLLFAISANAKTWQVGPTRQYTVPSAVMNLVADGDTVLIDSGMYVGDVGVWTNNNLVIRCPNGMARFNANGNIAQQKGIWVLAGNNTYVEGFEFYGAAISEANGDNGAGIRVGGNGLTCRRCYFHDNQEGILTANDTTNNNIWIEACEFDHNGVETGSAAGYEHNIYVGHSTSCTITFCYFHASIVGHEIKTRANANYILYNYIVDDTDGDGSYSIDIPNGGLTCVVGNAIEKGPKTENSTVVSYGEEGIINGDSDFNFISNTVVTDRSPTTFLNIEPGRYPGLIANNIFAGQGHPLTVNSYSIANVFSTDTSFFHFHDPVHYDYHPIANFQGLYSAEGFGNSGFGYLVLNAESEYVHPMDSTPRIPDHEIGAFEAVYPDTISDSIIFIQHFQPINCIGDTDWEEIWVMNTGNAGYDFGWSLYGPNESDFDIFGGGGKFIAPGEVDSFLVRFVPSVNGVEMDTIRIDGGTEQYLPFQDSVGSAIIAGAGSAMTSVGTIDTFTVIVSNTGTCPWTAGAPLVTPPFTYLSGGTAPLPGGANELFLFTFAPTYPGRFIQTVEFPSSTGISLPASGVVLTGITTSDGVTQPGTLNTSQAKINYPNPFTTETIIPLPSNLSSTLQLFNECGIKMDVTYSQTENGIVIERGNLPAGIYFYRISEAERGTIAEGSVVIGN